jgi:hypothetical protein
LPAIKIRCDDVTAAGFVDLYYRPLACRERGNLGSRWFGLEIGKWQH